MKDFEDLVKTIVNALDDEGQDRLREMEDWIIKNEGTWVLAEGFVSFLGKVLTDPAMPSEARVALLRLLAYGTGNDDIVLILHMDRKDHILMNYAQQCDRLPIREQEALALLVWNFSGKLAFFPGKISIFSGKNIGIFFPVCEPFRTQFLGRMVPLHFRMGVRQLGSFKHPGDNQSGGQRAFG